ncbi:Voltage-gated ClC-type chloride channel ClcB [Serratia fonticola]|uniref:Voltage-gated ClC-type chloride channel ClcB n=1 Tax=Serratia fonticola TaxID=47917 RepID=A0A4U9UA79_SERFO|nr:Voltage-gated ClC-type chloride channel ClcB [Serratia fonticola]
MTVDWPLTPALIKCLASLLVVSSGSTIGREGAMILLGALVGSVFAQRFTPAKEWKLWVACAAAAGMASAYHARWRVACLSRKSCLVR